MKSTSRFLTAGLAVLAFVSLASAQSTPTVVVVTGINRSYPGAMNQSGQFIGSGEITPGNYGSFLCDPATGQVQWLPAFGIDSVSAQALNDAGQVMGTFHPGGVDSYGNTIFRTFVWSAAGGYRDLGTLGGNYTLGGGINTAGQVFGSSETASNDNHAAFFWDGTTLRDLGTLGGGGAYANGMNNHGQVVGTAARADGSWAPFIWDAANGMREIPAGQDYAEPYGINDDGVVFMRDAFTGGIIVWDSVRGARIFSDPNPGVGFFSMGWRILGFFSNGQAVFNNQRMTGTIALVLDPITGWQTIASPDGSVVTGGVQGFSKSGYVASSGSSVLGDQHAFIWDAAHGTRDLGTLGGGNYSYAAGVNDRGQVTGGSGTASGETHAFLWDAATGMTDLGAGSPNSIGTNISNGAVAGYASTADYSTYHAFYAKLSAVATAPDLTITALATTNNKAPQGQKVTISATVKNSGTATAAASVTAFKDGTNVLGLLATPALAAGQSVTVSVDMRTASQNGVHVLSVAADSAGTVTESSETNNTASLTVTIKGNKVI